MEAHNNDKYWKRPLSVELEWYCKCGNVLGVYDCHAGGYGYGNFQAEYVDGEDIITCPDCKTIWLVEIRATPFRPK